jgi:putative restriction endonuclease
VDRIIPDPVQENHYYAEVSNYLPFTRPVPFKEGSHYYEKSLKKFDGSTNKGAFGNAVRKLEDVEFDLIWKAGFGHILGFEERVRLEPDVPEKPMERIEGFFARQPESSSYVQMEQDRPIVHQLISRPFRDKAFSAAVKTAYRDTCAVTGLKIINGGGRSEAQAAHIRPVQHQGPDSIRNGIALSGTVHWMFDRGLISVDDDYSLLIGKDCLPDTIERLLNGNSKLRLPARADLYPHPKFLDYHRRKIFKG